MTIGLNPLVMFCSKCGGTLQEGSRFCMQCGTPVSPSGSLEANATPETVPAPVLYAGFWLRFLAYFIDGIVLDIAGCLIGFVIGLVSLAINGASGGTPVGIRIFSLVMGFVAGWLYFALMESSRTQATLGKMALGIVVTDLEGNRLTFGRASGRFFGKIISTLICLVGFMMAGFTEKKQALHDMMAGTYVVMKSGRGTSGTVVVTTIAAVAFLGVLSMAVLAAILVPNFIRAREQSQLASCESNLKNIATSLELWATDHGGSYPENLQQLVPKYMPFIPVCPAAQVPTYAYQVTTRDQNGNPSGYEVKCAGSHHAALGIPADYPRYSSMSGLSIGR